MSKKFDLVQATNDDLWRVLCLMSEQFNTESFIQRARLVHGDKYDYSKVNYIRSHSKVIIICPIHNEFYQTPKLHLKGSGCKLCAIGWNSVFVNNSSSDKEKFIAKANYIHNNKYNYDKTEYNRASVKVTITCPFHGDFSQTPNAHLGGQGCTKCKILKLRQTFSLSKEEFIRRASSMHNNKYNYSLVRYVNAHSKIKIICTKHGIFKQEPNCHLDGSGCPRCRGSKGELSLDKILTFYGICFIREKRFKSCKINKPMRFDFYLPDYNILIEYQGQQHFVPHRLCNTLASLLYIVRNDEYKKRWAIEHGYIFKEYNYKQSWAFIEKDIKKLLK